MTDKPVELKPCTDLDHDCPAIEDKWYCWIYAPEHGYCPWLQSGKEKLTESFGKFFKQGAWIPKLSDRALIYIAYQYKKLLEEKKNDR